MVCPCEVVVVVLLYLVVELPSCVGYVCYYPAYMWMLCEFDEFLLIVVVVDVVVLFVG